jgi:hypothetical protein
MKRWFEEKGYELVWWLALREGRIARWLHDLWAGLWYQHYCPHPIIHDLKASSCIAAGHCGCSNGADKMEVRL